LPTLALAAVGSQQSNRGNYRQPLKTNFFPLTFFFNSFAKPNDGTLARILFNGDIIFGSFMHGQVHT
jgi:hypothetical protein